MEIKNWLPLLEYSAGNPLTLTVVIGQALHDGLKTSKELEAFVLQLRAGEANFKFDASEGRSESLTASLSYGFENAFSDLERKQLSLLYLFQGFVNIAVLREMGNPEQDYCLREIRGLTGASARALLSRAAEVGLLTDRGQGHYFIHPAVPFFFGLMFQKYYFGSEERATRSFVESMDALGNSFYWQVQRGDHTIIPVIAAEEENLLHALRIARSRGWKHAVVETMQGLRGLYAYAGRTAEWERLVKEIVPEFVDPETDGPLTGWEEQWSIVTEYRVRLATAERAYEEAERLQRMCVAWDRQRSTHLIEKHESSLDDEQRNILRMLAVSLEMLGDIQRFKNESGCLSSYEEALSIYNQIKDRVAEGNAAHSLGKAHHHLPEIQDLDQAEHWYGMSIQLLEKTDLLGESRAWNSLGEVSHQKFLNDRNANEPKADLIRRLNESLRFYRKALSLLPSSEVGLLATINQNLGLLYGEALEYDLALSHYNRSIQLFEKGGNRFEAARARYNSAVSLAHSKDHLPVALEYAKSALQNYDILESRGTAAQKANRLLEEIERRIIESRRD